jgi:hypothetical protein
MLRLMLVPAALLCLQGCAREVPAAAPRATAIKQTTSRLHFLHSYPPQAAAIPELGALLRKEGLERLAEARRDSAEVGFPPRRSPDKVEQVWEVGADTADLLALSSTASTYQDGAAHGYFSYHSLIWGRSPGRPLKLSELFSDRTGVAMLLAELCARLISEREARWREEGDGRPGSMSCPTADETDIAPVAERGGRIRSFRMRLTGDETPDGYAGGSYEIEAPVTAALVALVKPALRGSF